MGKNGKRLIDKILDKFDKYGEHGAEMLGNIAGMILGTLFITIAFIIAAVNNVI